MLLLFLLLSFARPTHAQPTPAPVASVAPGRPAPAKPAPLIASPTHPKTIVFLTDGLDFDDLRPNGALRDLRILANSGAIALLNPAVGGQATTAAAYLSVGAGEHISAPGKFGPKLYETGIPRTVADVAAEAYSVMPDPADPTRMTYIRRMGVAPPADAKVLAVGLPTIDAAQATPRVAAQIGALGEALRLAHVGVAVYGDWPAVLVGMDARGSAPAGQTGADLSPKALSGTLRDGDVIFVSVLGRQSLADFARAVAPLARHGIVNTLFADVGPPRTEEGSSWNRLGWVVAAGPAFPAGSVLTSPTTRTLGLIANVDLAPTILALAGAGDTLPGGAGRAATAQAAPVGAWTVLDRLDQQTVNITKTVVPLMSTFAVIGIVSGLLALAALHFQFNSVGKFAWVFLLSAAGMFFALPIMGLISPDSIREYVVGAVGFALLLAVVIVAVAGWIDLPPMGVMFGLLTMFIFVDALFDGYCVQRSINNFLPGIRYYGLGNEYLGALIGASLVTVGLLRMPSAAAITLFALLTLAIGLPNFGANSGGVIVSTVAFVIAAAAMRRTGRVSFRVVALAFVGGIAVSGALAFLDSRLAPGARSHAGVIFAAGQTEGAGLWAEIALRKLAMNLRIGLDHRTLIALAALLPVWWFLATGNLGARARAALAARPELKRLMPALVWATVAALSFKDSGIVTALILLACPTTAVLAAMLEDAGMAFFGADD